MMSKIKNLILFLVIAAVLVFAYVFFFKNKEEEPNLISSTPESNIAVDEENVTPSDEFLTVLLSVNNIKLDDSIFSEKAFLNLNDSSILLVAPGDEGRPNPFAPIGFEGSYQPIDVTNQTEEITPDTQI